jgi:hypothetical protein
MNAQTPLGSRDLPRVAWAGVFIWTLHELIGRFVNLRKQVGSSRQDLLPVTDFRLFAVCVHYPRDLAQQVQLTPIQSGVYEIRQVALVIRVIVINQLPREKHNAMFLWMSDIDELKRYGAENYHPRSPEVGMLL